MMHRSLPFTLLLLAASLGAQAPQTPGYSPAAARAERDLETSAIARPDTASARRHSRELSKESHIAGTPAQANTRDYVINQMKSWGLKTEVRSYDVWMPHTTEIKLWRVAPDTVSLNLAEGAMPGDSTSGPAPCTQGTLRYAASEVADCREFDSSARVRMSSISAARWNSRFAGIDFHRILPHMRCPNACEFPPSQ